MCHPCATTSASEAPGTQRCRRRPATGERDGRPVRIGAVTDQPDDWLSAIANGYGIALTPESSARFYARPGIVYRPVSGVSPSRVGVARSPAADTDPVVQYFVRCCLEVCRTDARRSPDE